MVASTSSGSASRSHATAGDAPIFVGGPPLRSQFRLGLATPLRPNVVFRMGAVVLLGWMPLLILSMVDGWPAISSFLTDYNAHARYLIAAPLFIAAEGSCLPRISALVENFRRTGLVAPVDHALFNHILQDTHRILTSAWAETAMVVAAYGLVFAAYLHVPLVTMPEWVYNARFGRLTPAGWWAVLLSLPLLLTLILGWMWRLLVWTGFLWRVSRMNLRLVSSHPDGAAGLGFIGYSSQAFSLLACAIGVLGAGHVAKVVGHGASFDSNHIFILCFVAGVVLFLNAPLLVFMRHLLYAWRLGTQEYGVLAEHFGREFERKWLNRMQPLDSKALEQPDFSAATDLYQVVDRSYGMRVLPIQLKSLIMLALATVLPFIPVALMSVPFDVVVSKLLHLMF